MVYASSANPSGKGNRGKVEGIGERIEGAVDLVIEADDYVASIQPDKTIGNSLWTRCDGIYGWCGRKIDPRTRSR